MLPGSPPSDVRSHPHDHSHGAREANDEHHGSPGHTCCELTGKYAYTADSSPPSAAPAVVLVTMPTPAQAPTGLVAARLNHLSPEPPRHPPPYLRFLTLLI